MPLIQLNSHAVDILRQSAILTFDNTAVEIAEDAFEVYVDAEVLENLNALLSPKYPTYSDVVISLTNIPLH